MRDHSSWYAHHPYRDHDCGFWLRPQYVDHNVGVGIPIVASITLRYVIADIIARLWVAAIDSRSECH
jgi:hypothetical protein